MKCRGYHRDLTPWACLENQLSPMCLPGWPCHECRQGVRIAVNRRKPKTIPKALTRAVARA